jgi:hypothetical protein
MRNPEDLFSDARSKQGRERFNFPDLDLFDKKVGFDFVTNSTVYCTYTVCTT